MLCKSFGDFIFIFILFLKFEAKALLFGCQV